MRNSGVRFECLRMKPHDHIGWVFGGHEEFAELARPFLEEGAARGERLMYVAADAAGPGLAGPVSILGPDAMQIASIAEVYGPTGIVDAGRQRATFEAALADALAAGYSGIRVAADNTPLVTDERRLAAWIKWEVIADRLMSAKPITGLCAFDGSKVDVDKLRHLATLHPLSSAASPVPQFRLFNDAGNLCVEGEIDSSAISQLRLALSALPAKTGILVDLATATLLSATALGGLGRLANAGFDVIVRGPAAAIERLTMSGGSSTERFILQTA
jgi:hypothetical protein